MNWKRLFRKWSFGPVLNWAMESRAVQQRRQGQGSALHRCTLSRSIALATILSLSLNEQCRHDWRIQTSRQAEVVGPFQETIIIRWIYVALEISGAERPRIESPLAAQASLTEQKTRWNSFSQNDSTVWHLVFDLSTHMCICCHCDKFLGKEKFKIYKTPDKLSLFLTKKTTTFETK